MPAVVPQPKPKPKAKPKATLPPTPYMTGIDKLQKAQNDALVKMWGKDKGRKKVQIRTK